MKKTRPFHYRVDFAEEKIEISKAFATAAQKANTSAHKQLMDLRKAYPGFGITIYKTEITASKQTYKGLNHEEMRRCIIEWSGKDSPNLAVLDKAIADKVPMPTIKKWYLGIYGEHYKHTNMTMPVLEEGGIENADAATDNC